MLRLMTEPLHVRKNDFMAADNPVGTAPEAFPAPGAVPSTGQPCQLTSLAFGYINTLRKRIGHLVSFSGPWGMSARKVSESPGVST